MISLLSAIDNDKKNERKKREKREKEKDLYQKSEWNQRMVNVVVDFRSVNWKTHLTSSLAEENTRFPVGKGKKELVS